MKKFISILLVGLTLLGTISAKQKEKKQTDTNVDTPSTQLGIVDSLKNLSSKLLTQVKDKPIFAFMALSSDDGNTLFEDYVTDALTEAMFNTGKIKIVERSSLEKILKEQQFQRGGLVNENTAKEIGQLSSADYVCYGTTKDLGDQVSLNVRIVEVESGEVFAIGRDIVYKDKYLNQKTNATQTTNEKPKIIKTRIENESDLIDNGFQRFKTSGAEDYLIFPKDMGKQYEIDVWAIDKKDRLKYFGTIIIDAKKGYKSSPFDKDIKDYKSLWMKIKNDDTAIIKYVGEKSHDLYFEIIQ